MRNEFLTYFEFSRIAFLKILAYRLRYFTGILTYVVNVSVYYFIWRAIYSASPRVAGYDLAQMTTYVAVGWTIRSFYFNNIDREMAAEVIEGRIAINLIKPVDAQLMYVSQTAGESCFRFLMFTLPIALLLFVVYPVRPPATAAAGAAFALSSIFALMIFALINFLVGTMALQIQSIMGVIRAVRRVLLFLPFPHLSYTPLEIYLGRLGGAALAGSLAIQVAWIAVLFAAGRLYWRFATRRLSIQGG